MERSHPYQEGVGPTPVGIDFSKYGHLTDVDEIANIVLTNTKAIEQWEPIVQAERAEIDIALKSRGIVF
jgi:hypothetical protein